MHSRGVMKLVATTLTMGMIFPITVVSESFTHEFVPYGSATSIVEKDEYTYDDPSRQHLHIMVPDNAKDPTPVLLWSHGNGGVAANFGDNDLVIVKNTGYALISWESVTPVSSLTDSQTCASDLLAVLEWMENNKQQYNLDTSKLMIGGRSRGTGCSWSMAHSEEYSDVVIGLYMYGALPDPSWLNPDADPRDVVTVNSPPARFLYKATCPKPITVDCVPVPYDIHNPANGQKVNLRYEQLGIGPKFGLTDENSKDEKFVPFPAFAECLEKHGLDCHPEDITSNGADSTLEGLAFIRALLLCILTFCMF